MNASSGISEVIPGIFHWSSAHPKLGGAHVSSYWLDRAGVLIDPLVPADGLEWFAERSVKPTTIVLTNRHHYRDSDSFHQQFGCEIYAPEAGMHEFTAGQPVTAYAPGTLLPGDLRAIEIGSLCPDENALYSADTKTVWIADAVVRAPEDLSAQIGWVLDQLMDNPTETKQGMLAAFTTLLAECDFENLCLAHGRPLIGNGRTALEEFVRSGGHTATDAF